MPLKMVHCWRGHVQPNLYLAHNFPIYIYAIWLVVPVTMHLIQTKEGKQIKNQKFIWRRFHSKRHLIFNSAFYLFFSLAFLSLCCALSLSLVCSVPLAFSFSAALGFNAQSPFPLCVYSVCCDVFFPRSFCVCVGNVLNEWLPSHWSFS